MRQWIDALQSDGFTTIRAITDLDVRKTCCEVFNTLAQEQRGEPERMGGAMVYNTGLTRATGLYTFHTEHAGDLTHRMSERYATGSDGDGNFGMDTVGEKVHRLLDQVRNPYGLEREIREQTERNHDYSVEMGRFEGSLQEFWDEVEEGGLIYAAAHRKLTVYNEAQWTAREAAIAIGEMNFTAYENHLSHIEKYLDDLSGWVSWASQVRLAPDGTPMPFMK
jgi:hypothetical protein